MRRAALIMLLFLVGLSVWGAGGTEKKAETSPAAATATAGAPKVFDKGKTNAVGLPIVKSPVEIEVAYVSATNYGDPNKYLVWDQMAKATGIKFKFRVLTNTQNLNLMYASQDYPDLGWFNAVPSNKVWDDAVLAGDIVNLKPYLDDGLAPAFVKFFADYPLYKAMTTYSDGGIYFLPGGTPDGNIIRDIWLINQIYLDQLGLKVPATLAELTDYFRAVKANVGKGKIPSNAIPFYYMYTAGANATFEDIYSVFGLTEGLRAGPYVVDGKVKHNLTNKALVEAIKYQALLYKEGLTSPQAFTDDATAMTMYLQSKDPTLTGFLTYNDNRTLTHWTHIAPVTGPKGSMTYLRNRQDLAIKGCVVYKRCEYTAAVVRFFQYVDEDNERWIAMYRGQKGAAWEYVANGTDIRQLVTSIANLQEKDRGFTQTALFMNKAKYDWFVRVAETDPKNREFYWKNLYAKYVLPGNIFYYPGIPSCFSKKEIEAKNTEISTNVWAYANEVMANWIMGKGNIDAEWDAFVAKVNSYGWETYLKNLQDTYDAFNRTLK